MKIYTRTGDQGDTGLFGGDRVSKASARVEAYGEVDELNSVLGVVRLHKLGGASDDDFDRLLAAIQSRLFDVGAELANAKGKDLGIPLVDDRDIEEMERAIDRALRSVLPRLKALGLDPETGEEITRMTHDVLDRVVDYDVYRDAVRRLTTSGFHVTENVEV